MSRHALIIGAQRSGTTFLNQVLGAHPDIAVAQPSRPEPKFFLDEECLRKGRDWYDRTYFSHHPDAAVKVDKSTSYIESPQAAERAAKIVGDAVIFVSLRDPVARAVSNWRFSTTNGFEERPLDVALAENLRSSSDWDPAATSVSPFAYLERGRYADYLTPWLDHFGPAVRVWFLENLAANAEVIGDVYRHAGVDDSFLPDDMSSPVNASTGEAPELDAGLEAELREFFADGDNRLRGIVGQPLPWKTG